MQRVDFCELEYDQRGFDDTLFRGNLFTGIAVDIDEVSGVLLAEESYLHGWRHGPSREWRKDGSIQEEGHFSHGALHGPRREWDERGLLNLEEIWEMRLLIGRRRWTVDGSLIQNETPLRDPKVRAVWLERWAKFGHGALVEMENDEFVEKPWPYGYLASVV